MNNEQEVPAGDGCRQPGRINILDFPRFSRLCCCHGLGVWKRDGANGSCTFPRPILATGNWRLIVSRSGSVASA